MSTQGETRVSDRVFGRFTSGAPEPITSRTKKRDVVGGVCSPPQTLAAIDRSGRGGRNQQRDGFGGSQSDRKAGRQTKPKLSGRARKREAAAEKADARAARRGGKR